MAGDEIAWFRKPTPTNQAPYDGGTLNLSYQLLDKAIVEGAADESVLVDVRGSWSHALLLEHVAAFGGALKGLGVLPGDRVLVDLADDLDTVVVLLGASRVGAVTVRPPTLFGEAELAMFVASAEPSVVVTSRPGLELADADPVVISRDPSPEGSAVAWDVVLRAGRTDPAGAENVAADAASALVWPEGPDRSVRVRTTVEQALALLEATRSVPVAAAELVGVLTR
jgi:acyl-coenzyme A synthetase/AMP-(fatty) acid ligase